MPDLFFNIKAADSSDTNGIDFRLGLKFGIESIDERKFEAIAWAPQLDFLSFSSGPP